MTLMKLFNLKEEDLEELERNTTTTYVQIGSKFYENYYTDEPIRENWFICTKCGDKTVWNFENPHDLTMQNLNFCKCCGRKINTIKLDMKRFDDGSFMGRNEISEWMEDEQ